MFWTLFLIILYNLIFGNSSCFKRRSLQKQIAAIEDSISRLKQVNDSLSLEEKKLLYDYNYLEKIARERLGMAKPGEKIYRYYHKDSSQQDTNKLK
ncbi:MAG: septum formation initiator family protein [Candidatus Delongbacteria bacterium]|nr:septum formation initiator family protein [Candidatus Delongbacteria bacterium]